MFRRLKPHFGKRIDDLWIAYNIGGPEDKQAIDEVLTILAVKRLGIAIGDEKITLEPPTPSVIGGGEYTIGHIEYPGLAPYPFTLHRNDLLRHVFILAPSGGGKTTLNIGILRQLLRDGIPWWSIDWKRNYRCLLNDEHAKDLVVLTIGRETAPLRLNMLRAPAGVEATEWVYSISDIISVAYLLLQGARNVMAEALLGAIAQHGERATLRDALGLLRHELGTTRSGGRRYGWLESAYRSIEELTKGAIGESLNDPDGITLARLLVVPVVFELQALGEDQKRAFCLYLLQAVLLFRKHQHDEREVLKHVIVCDEAHNVFPKDHWGVVSVPSKIAREIREYGEGLISLTQQGDVADSLIANSGVKFFMRVDYPRDADMVSKMLQVDVGWLAKIPLGQAIARLPTRWYKPFLFSFPEQPIKNRLVSDAFVAERYAQWRGPAAPPINPTLAVSAPVAEMRPRDVELVLDIAEHPISTVTQRYERLRWNPKTGNGIKDAVINSALAEFVVLEAGRGRVKLLALTLAGEDVVRKHGGTIRRSGRAGLEHEFWRARIKERCEARGYTVTEEYHLGGGKHVDLRAHQGDRVLLIEVETGKSDVSANIAKCAGHGPLVVFFTSLQALDAACALVPEGVLVVAPESINRLHDVLR